MTTSILYGGEKHVPYHIKGFRNEESFSIKKILDLCDREGITRLSVAFSGLYYERRTDGWYLTSDTEQCDRFHSLPPEGKKV